MIQRCPAGRSKQTQANAAELAHTAHADGRPLAGDRDVDSGDVTKMRKHAVKLRRDAITHTRMHAHTYSRFISSTLTLY